jgi:TolB-like protein
VYSADGRLLAAAGETGYGWWDAQAGTPQRREAGRGLLRVAFNTAGTLVAAGGSDGRVLVSDLRMAGAKEVARHAKAVGALALKGDGRMGASGDDEGAIILWDPAQGPIATLKEGSGKSPIVFLAFTGADALLSVAHDMTVTTWDVNGKRARRRGALQARERGREIEPHAVALDATSGRLLVAAQLIAQQRGGALSTGRGQARPGDLTRDNVLLPYDVASGISSDAVVSGDFTGETLAVSPAGCYAVFTSSYRDQPRLHIWGLVEKGDDLLRQDLPRRAEAIAIDPSGRALAVAAGGRIATYRVSGITTGDCELYSRKPSQGGGPKVTVGSETSPLIATTGTKPVVAVLRFDTTTNVSADVGDGVSEMVSTELSNSQAVTIVERAAIEQVMKELSIQRSGLTDDANVARIGKGLNAQKMILGSVRRFGDDTFVLTARVVDVATQRNEGTREVTCERCK